MAKPESQFPTIADMHRGLAELISAGLGDLPVQVLVAPDSTMQAICKVMAGPDYDNRPALMIELTSSAETRGRLPVCLVSADRMSGQPLPPVRDH